MAPVSYTHLDVYKRQDLYYRLNVIQLKMPALRDRPSDISLLSTMLLAKLCSNLNIAIPQIDSATQAYISQLPFAGNVRELENMLERALAMCDGKTITVDDLLHQDQIRVERREMCIRDSPYSP